MLPSGPVRQPYAIVDNIPVSETKNLASGTVQDISILSIPPVSRGGYTVCACCWGFIRLWCAQSSPLFPLLHINRYGMYSSSPITTRPLLNIEGHTENFAIFRGWLAFVFGLHFFQWNFLSSLLSVRGRGEGAWLSCFLWISASLWR